MLACVVYRPLIMKLHPSLEVLNLYSNFLVWGASGRNQTRYLATKVSEVTIVSRFVVLFNMWI